MVRLQGFVGGSVSHCFPGVGAGALAAGRRVQQTRATCLPYKNQAGWGLLAVAHSRLFLVLCETVRKCEANLLSYA